MKRFFVACLCAGALFSMNSCSGVEGDGHAAYNQSKKYQGDQRRMFEKKAYKNYSEVLGHSPAKISPKLRNRFLELSVMRGQRMLTEGSYFNDGVALIRDEIDKYWTPEVPDDVKNAYADFLALQCDSGFEHKQVLTGLKFIDKAIEVSADKPKYMKAKTDRVAGFVEQYLSMAKAEWEQGLENKDAEGLVRAEFYAKMVLEFDPANAEATALLSKAYTENKNTYSLYKKVITEYPDTALFKKINKQDIFLALVSMGKGNKMDITMWNYSYNPQRLKSESFYLVDDKGNKVVATPASKLQPEFLNFEIETKLTLVFPSIPDKIEKLVYDNPPHYAEKRFY